MQLEGRQDARGQIHPFITLVTSLELHLKFDHLLLFFPAQILCFMLLLYLSHSEMWEENRRQAVQFVCSVHCLWFHCK